MGSTSFDGRVPMQRYTIFRLASTTKPITAAGAMILVEECRIRLDDPVDDWLPELSRRDRGYALERAWEVATEDVLARPFLSFFPNSRDLEDAAPWRPALLFNATHQDTGRRVITSHLKVERHIFLVYLPNRHLSTKVRAFIDFFVERIGPQPYWD